VFVNALKWQKGNSKADPKSLCQAPSALFWAGVAKATSDEMSVIENLLREIQRKGKVLTMQSYGESMPGSVYGNDEISIESVMLSEVRNLLAYLRGISSRKDQGSDKNFSSQVHHFSYLAAEARKELQYHLDRFSLLSKLPFDFRLIPANAIHAANPEVEKQWVNTQLLLAAGNAPDREYILHKEYQPCVKALKRQSFEKIFLKFMKRMTKRRSMSLSEGEFSLLRSIVQSQYVSMRQGWPEILSDEVALEIIIQLSADEEMEEYRAADAKAIARGDRGTAREMIDEAERGEDPASIRDGIVTQLDWVTMTLDDVQNILQVGTLSASTVVGGIAQMPKRVRDSCIQWMLDEWQADSGWIGKMIELGLVAMSSEFVSRCAEHIPVDYLGKYFVNLVTDIDKVDLKEDETKRFQLLMHCMQLLPVDVVKEAFEYTANRWYLARSFVPYLESLFGQRSSRKLAEEIIAKIHGEFWREMVLASRVLDFQSFYESTLKTPECYEYESGVVDLWEDLSVDLSSLGDLKELFALRSLDETREVLGKYSEEAIFLWCYQGMLRSKMVDDLSKVKYQRYLAQKASFLKIRQAELGEKKKRKKKDPLRSSTRLGQERDKGGKKKGKNQS
jgi:hypothetical protein